MFPLPVGPRQTRRLRAGRGAARSGRRQPRSWALPLRGPDKHGAKPRCPAPARACLPASRLGQVPQNAAPPRKELGKRQCGQAPARRRHDGGRRPPSPSPGRRPAEGQKPGRGRLGGRQSPRDRGASPATPHSARRAREAGPGEVGGRRGGRGGTRVGTMAIDWIGFAYAALLAVGGVVGYTRKGSKTSLAAGLTFGSVAGYGAYCITRDPRNVKISLFSAFLLTIIMGMRFKRSKKLMPAGLVACLSLLMILRLVFMLL
ncbi:transmembrane protein 14A isoform 1-T1 [Ciconia maguari]